MKKRGDKSTKKKTIIGLIAIVAIVAVVIFTGCIEEKPPTEGVASETSSSATSYPEAPERHRVGQAPVLVPYRQSGLKTTDRQYDSSGLVSRTELLYFESTGGSGEVQITARLEELETATTRLEEQETSITTLVEAGKFYKLSVPLEGTLYTIVDEPRLIIESPALASPHIKQYEKIGMGPWSMSLLLGKMYLEEWEPPAPNWGLAVKILSGDGTVSADPGRLLFSGEPLIKTKNWHPKYINYHPGYEDGTEVTVTATPAEGYVFDHWGVLQSDREYSITKEPPSITIWMTGATQVHLYFAWEACAVPGEAGDRLPLYRVILYKDDVHTSSEEVEALLDSIPGMTDVHASDIAEDVERSGQSEVVPCPLKSAELYRDRLEAFGLIVTVEPVERR
jgi:ATP-dependent Clp protease adapter protein ClpS